MMNKAVVLGVNYYIGLSVLRSLKQHGVPTVAVDYDLDKAYAASSNKVDEVLLVPHYEHQAQACCDALVDFAKQQTHKPVLYPCADQYVAFVCRFFDVLNQHYLMQYEDPTLTLNLMNKDQFSEVAKKHGINIPKTLFMDDPHLFETVESIGYPWIVKGVDSSHYVSTFRVKLHQVDNKEQLTHRLEQCKKQGVSAIIQQVIVGFDDHMVTYDAYTNNDHQVTHAITCQKLRQYPINYGASVMTTVVYNKKLHHFGKQFLEAVQWRGFAELEFKIDAKTNELYLIEMNVRTTNFTQMLTHVGLNFPWITYCELTNQALPGKTITYDIPVAFVYGYENALAFKDYIKAHQMTLKRAFVPFSYKKVYAIFDWKDLKPWIHFMRLLMNKAIKKLRRTS